MGPGSDFDRIELATELIEVAEKAGDHELAIEGRGMRLMDLLEAGESRAVDREMPIYDREARYAAAAQLQALRPDPARDEGAARRPLRRGREAAREVLAARPPGTASSRTRSRRSAS